MEFRRDWDRVKRTFSAWWDKQADYPLVQVTAPKRGAVPADYDGWAFLRYQDDPERAIALFEEFAAATFFGGEAFPNLFPNLGPGALAAYFSGYLRYEQDALTAWFEDPKPWEEVERFALQDNHWRRYTRDILCMALRAAKGRYVVGTADIGGILDVLASFRGAEPLAMDLLTDAERVNAMRRKILDAWHIVYDDLDTIIRPQQEGTSAWMGLWCPGTYYPLQCDFGAMISPAMFETFVIPDVEEQCRRLDYAIYHLDGPGQIAHLDLLLDIPELDGIQWIPGTGNPQNDCPEWFPMYEKIIAKNKLVVLQCWDDVANLPALLEAIPNRNLLISASAPDEDAAHALLKTVKRPTS